mmetsp:Transcript_93427/g.241513  ORF Transcript_93427/g.241513 Transcript_93427/m.241513 type:complete len:205 (+) Transcript_93427:534-1148(+)
MKDSSSSWASLLSLSTRLISFNSRWLCRKSFSSLRRESSSWFASFAAWILTLTACAFAAFRARAWSKACLTRSSSSRCSSMTSWISLLARSSHVLYLIWILSSRRAFRRSTSALFAARTSACFFRSRTRSCSRRSSCESYSSLSFASCCRFLSSSCRLFFSNSSSLARIAAERFRLFRSSPSRSAISPTKGSWGGPTGACCRQA